MPKPGPAVRWKKDVVAPDFGAAGALLPLSLTDPGLLHGLTKVVGGKKLSPASRAELLGR